MCNFVCSFALHLHRDDVPADDPAARASALFLATSIFNHQCLPNSTSSFHRDVSIVRARTAIKKGEEVFITYVPMDRDHDVRLDFFRPVFENGICPCELCKLDRLDGSKQVAIRHKILKEEYLPYRQRKQSGVPILDKEAVRTRQELLLILARLESTYSSSRGPLRPELSDICHLIADVSISVPVHLRQVAIDYRLRAFESAGAKFEKQKGSEIKVVVPPVPLQPHVDPVGLCLLTACTYLQVLPKDSAACLSWIQAAADMEKLLRQGTFASIRQRNAELLKDLKIVTLFNEAEKLSLKRRK